MRLDKSHKKNFIRKTVLILGILLLLDLVCIWVYHTFVVAANVSMDKTHLKDGSALVIFFHGPSKNKSGLDDTTKFRIKQTAFSICKSLPDIDCVMLGGHWSLNSHIPFAMLHFARQTGLTGSRVLGDDWSHDTLSNLEALEGLQARYRWNHMAMCSSKLHLFRIRYLIAAKGFLPGVKLDFLNCDAGMPKSWLDIWQEFHHEWLAFGLYFFLTDDSYRTLMQWARQ